MSDLKLRTFIESSLQNRRGANAVEPDAELIALEQEYRKWADEKLRAHQDLCKAWVAAHNEWPEGLTPEMTFLLEDCGAGANYKDIQTYLERNFLTPQRAEAKARGLHSDLLRNRLRYQELLERHGWFKALERKKEAEAREPEAFERLMETPAQTLSGVQIKLGALYLEGKRREDENSTELSALRTSDFTAIAG